MMNVRESLVLECEFSTEYFYLFDNPVLWMKSQQDEATYVNLMSNINKPFSDTGRFEVSFTPLPPRYRLELVIVGECGRVWRSVWGVGCGGRGWGSV